MFSKIKGKLKNVFKLSEEIIEDKEINDENIELSKNIEKKNNLSNNDIKKIKNIKLKEKKENKIKKEENLKKDEIQKNEINTDLEKKKGFLNNLFSKNKKKDSEINEVEEIKKVQNSLLKDVSENEIEAIKNKNKLDAKEVKNNLDKLDLKIKNENKLEKLNFDEEIKVKKKTNLISKTFEKLKSKKITIDDFEKIWIEIEIFLLEINIAFEIVEEIEIKLKDELLGNSFNRFKLTEKIREVLEKKVREVLKTRESNLLEKIKNFKKNNETPIKILILGVNGTGKTTTIAKIVNYFKKNNLSIVVAAADTFRAAAIEQLEEHSKKLNFKLIQHKNGSDPAAVTFDAIEHAKAKKLDIVLIDTAGRMPNNSNLMQELKKIKRVSKAQISIFIGDSISGNDLIEQINLFNKNIEIDGLILTKIDTDEKPGSIVTSAYSIEKPIYFLGIGQNYDDLIKFDAEQISKKLFEIN